MVIGNRPISRGYTLIEIIAVVAILGILSLIAIPQFGPNDDQKIASAAREITADLLYAQSQAIATGKTHYVVFDSADGYRIMDSMIPPHPIPHPASGLPYEIHFTVGPLRGVTVTNIDFNGAGTLAFDPTGMPCSISPETGSLSPLVRGSAALKVGQSTLTLTIEPLTGAVNIH
ncbi:MAG TPA: GspH/FimT family pseudopilin [Tepidisphaeraceae bacterium]|jgi:prepilin-type N-terminal cleavage/methylation domain-containing protein|nr:GspH/FimT family pseudopilin [Tepidisphaeraceae bacterium]